MSWTSAYHHRDKVLVKTDAGWRAAIVETVTDDFVATIVDGNGPFLADVETDIRPAGATLTLAMADSGHTWPAHLEQILPDGRVSVRLHGIGDRAVSVPASMIR